MDLNIQISTENEGDIITTSPRTNPDGGIIPNMYGKPIRDIALISNENYFKQIIYNRITTQNPDWFLHMNIGSDLEDLIGKQNTRETADIGINNITRSLLHGGLLKAGDFSIRAIPVSLDSVVFLIDIFKPYSMSLYVSFNYNDGLAEVELL